MTNNLRLNLIRNLTAVWLRALITCPIECNPRWIPKMVRRRAIPTRCLPTGTPCASLVLSTLARPAQCRWGCCGNVDDEQGQIHGDVPVPGISNDDPNRPGVPSPDFEIVKNTQQQYIKSDWY